MAVFSNGGGTSPDVFLGLFCILVVLICSTLNPLVFVHNYRKNNSLARCLYLTLSTADFLTAWILTASFAVNIFKGKVEECVGSDDLECNDQYFKRTNEAHYGQKIHGVIGWTVALAPSNITAFLAMSRYYQIRYPLERPRIKLVMLGLLLSLSILPVVSGCAIFDESETSPTFVLPITNLAWNFNPRVFGVEVTGLVLFLLLTSVTWLLQFGAVVASLLTVYELVKSHMKPVSGGTQGRKTRSSLKILITNVGSVVILSAYAVQAKGIRGDEGGIGLTEGIVYLMTAVGIPSITSMLNPIIYIILTPKCSLSFKKKRERSVRVVVKDTSSQNKENRAV